MTGFSQRSFDQAVAWFVALQDENCSAKTRARFERWLASDATHGQAYAVAENLWGNLDGLKQFEVPGMDAARSARPGSASWRSVRGGIAGLLLAAAAAGWWLDFRAPVLDVATGIGERRSIALADGSRVELNAASHLTAKVSWCRREVQLQQGQALFQVTHRAFPSFTVAVENFEIRDIGTRFDVRLSADETRVAVLEGEVALKSRDSWIAETLETGYSRRIPKHGRWLPAEPVDAAKAVAWLDGRLAFEHTPLAEVVDELQRHHNLHFVLADSSLAAETLSGSFNATDLKPFLNAMEKILPIRVRRERNQVVLSRRR